MNASHTATFNAYNDNVLRLPSIFSISCFDGKVEKKPTYCYFAAKVTCWGPLFTQTPRTHRARLCPRTPVCVAKSIDIARKLCSRTQFSDALTAHLLLSRKVLEHLL